MLLVGCIRSVSSRGFLKVNHDLRFLPLSAGEQCLIITLLHLCPWQLDNLVRAYSAWRLLMGSLKWPGCSGQSAKGDYYTGLPQREEDGKGTVFYPLWHTFGSRCISLIEWFFSHTSHMAVGQFSTRLKYPINHWMDCLELLFRHPCFQSDGIGDHSCSVTTWSTLFFS